MQHSTLSLYGNSLSSTFSPSSYNIFGIPRQFDHVQHAQALSESFTEPSPSKKHQSKGKKSKGRFFQKIVNRFSHSTSNETPTSANLRKKRASCPNVCIVDEQVASERDDCCNKRRSMCIASFNGVPITEFNGEHNVFYPIGHEYHNRSPQHHQSSIQQRQGSGQTHLAPPSPVGIHLAPPSLGGIHLAPSTHGQTHLHVSSPPLGQTNLAVPSPGQTHLAPPSLGHTHLAPPTLRQTHLAPPSLGQTHLAPPSSDYMSSYPSPPRPTVIVRPRASSTRNRPKTWAFCNNHVLPSENREQTTCDDDDVIVEESMSQVSLWNIPEQSLGEGHVS